MTFLRNMTVASLFLSVTAMASLQTQAATVTPAATNKPAPLLVPQSPATVRMNANTTFKQLLALPDATVVQSPDGKQSTTVGAIRASMQARQKQIQSTIQSGKLVTGGKITLPVPHGLNVVAGLRKSIAQENNTALSLRTTANLNQPSRIYQALNPTPGIYSVNGKKSGFILSPGTALVIKGAGFGKNKGLTVMRGLPRGDVELSVMDWRDNEIYAQLPATPSTMSGLPDGAVSVVLYAQNNQQYLLGGGTFYANRADVIVSDYNAARLIGIQFDPNAPAPFPGAVPMYDHRESWDFGDDPSKLNTCWSPGGDYLTTHDPGRGFVVTGLTFAWGRNDTGDGDGFGDAGSRVFTPGYSLGDWNGDTLPVHFGVWRSHHSPYLWVPSIDFCMTEYIVTSVTLTGPAGIPPF
jgi:hypothetical protein